MVGPGRLSLSLCSCGVAWDRPLDLGLLLCSGAHLYFSSVGGEPGASMGPMEEGQLLVVGRQNQLQARQ